MKSKVILHVGIHKTGTTFLQNNYFAKHPELGFLPLRFGLYLELNNLKQKKVLLASNENLVGNPFGFNIPPDLTNFNNYSWLESNKNIFTNISNLFKIDGVIIGVRDQQKLIVSLYKQYLHMGGIKTINDFFDIDNNTGIIKKQDLDFAQRIELIKKYLTDNILVYDLDELKDIKAFEDKLNQFIGVKNYNLLDNVKSENIGVEGKNIERLRRLNILNYKLITSSFKIPTLNNYFFRRSNLTPRDIFQTKLKKMAGNKFKLPNETKKKIDEYYLKDRMEMQRYF